MRVPVAVAVGFLLPASLGAQQQPARAPQDGVMVTFVRFADIFGSRLVDAFDSIPASRYDYKPMPAQQTIGYIAQHLEDANYSLCERASTLKWKKTAKDSLPDTVKARWPKDTLVARLRASLRFCDTALESVPKLDSPALAATLLAFETDLAEHYSQLSVYMRLIGLVPPSALPPKTQTAIELPASSLSPFVGTYDLATGIQIFITVRDGALFVASSNGGDPIRLWPESPTSFFVKEADAQIAFTRDGSGKFTALVLHQFGRDRTATRR
jgi:hypothetical protein